MRRVAKKRAAKFYVALVLAVIIFLFFQGRETKPLEGATHFVTKPFSKFFSNSGRFFHEKFSFVFSIGQLKSENSRLLEENLKLKSRVVSLDDIKKENNELREQLELAPRDEYELKAAMIIGHDLSGDTGDLIIDIGADHGIKKQMAVIFGEGVLIGKVRKVLKSTSYVEVVTGKNTRINAEIIESGAKGIVRGQFGTGAVLDMVPQTVEVNKGDAVVTSGVGNLLPRGFLIGYAQDPITTPDQLFQQASLVLPVAHESIRMAWVVVGEKK